MSEKAMNDRTEWPIRFFDDEYLRIYRPQLTPERTRAEADFLFGALGLPAGASVLDLACGTGRHAIELARRGLRITGVDLNEDYLERAAADARDAGVEVRWKAADMRRLGFDAEFDGAYSYFTSFGYFSDEENEAVLGELARAVRPGGALVLDMVNRDRLLVKPPGRTWSQREDGGLLMEEFTLEPLTSRVHVRQTLIEPTTGPRPVREYELRTYTCAELGQMLRRRGFEPREAWGGADRSPYTAESTRLVVLAVRRPESR